ncbi:MAG: TonB-dependent receptor [candidate division WOR-3 bacterium]
MLLAFLLSTTLHGMIADAETGNPLAGAAVVVEGKGVGTYSDESGHFMLTNAPDPPITLLISMLGYQTERIELLEIPSHLSVGLKPAAIGSEEIEIISSPTLHDMSQSPVPTQKLDAIRLQSANQTSLQDALRLLPGITVSGDQSSGAADGFSPRLQGLLAHHTLVLLDGKRLFCHDGAGSNISSVPLLLVERIEVIEGASCAIHGSDALGGIINIITKKPSPEPMHAFRANYGTYGNLEVGAAFGGPGPAGSAYILSMGQKAYEGRRESDAYERLSASWKSAWKGFRLNGDYSEGTLGRENPERFWNTIGEAGFTWMAGFSHNELSAYANHYGRAYGSSDATNLVAEIKGESHLGVSYHNLMMGAVLRQNQFERTGLSLSSESFYGFYFEDDARPRGWLNLDLAGRLDRYPIGGFQLTPKAGFQLEPNRSLVIKAYFGRGFRAPSLQDRYEENVPAGSYYRQGNPNLVPEIATSYSSGIKFSPISFMSLSVSGFYNKVSNIMVPLPTGDSLDGLPVLTLQNIPKAHSWGVSLNLRLEREPAWADLSYTYLNTRDDSTGMPLGYEPKHTLSGQLTFEQRGIGASLTGELVKDRLYVGGLRLPDYFLLNLNLFARPLNGVQVNFGVQNLLDEKNLTSADGSASLWAGRAFGGGMNVRF